MQMHFSQQKNKDFSLGRSDTLLHLEYMNSITFIKTWDFMKLWSFQSLLLACSHINACSRRIEPLMWLIDFVLFIHKCADIFAGRWKQQCAWIQKLLLRCLLLTFVLNAFIYLFIFLIVYLNISFPFLHSIAQTIFSSHFSCDRVSFFIVQMCVEIITLVQCRHLHISTLT